MAWEDNEAINASTCSRVQRGELQRLSLNIDAEEEEEEDDINFSRVSCFLDERHLYALRILFIICTAFHGFLSLPFPFAMFS